MACWLCLLGISGIDFTCEYTVLFPQAIIDPTSSWPAHKSCPQNRVGWRNLWVGMCPRFWNSEEGIRHEERRCRGF